MEPVPPALLTIAGFDPSSGAGITADLKVFAAFGAYGVACPTAWTVQSTQGVQRVVPAQPGLVRDTLQCLAGDIPVAGVKIGMLADLRVLEAVIEWLRGFSRQFPDAPVVLDPVMRSSSGRMLLAQAALPLLRRELLPLVSVATPNLAEAALLAELPVNSPESAEAAAEAIRLLMGPDGAVVITGHAIHVPGTWVETSSTHGTGCAFSSALTALLVHDAGLPEAVAGAKRYVEGALRAAYPVGKGRGPMHHLHTLHD
jgi:hydroxymethylpyrimidine/phosphomethylpyrimidine kinase